MSQPARVIRIEAGEGEASSSLQGRWSRPRLAELPTWGAVVLACCLIYLGFVIWSQIRFRSYQFALDYAMGARLQVEPSPLRLGTRRLGERLDATIRLRNHGGKPVTILGAIVACPCVANRGLPRIIPAGEAVVLPISIQVEAVPGDWRRVVHYLTDLPGQSDVTVELHCEVLPPATVPARPPTEAHP